MCLLAISMSSLKKAYLCLLPIFKSGCSPCSDIELYKLLIFWICAFMQWLQLCPTFRCPVDCSCQAPLSMGFSRQEYWSELSCLPPAVFPTQRLNPCLLCLLHCRLILHCRATGEALYFAY